jgi:hypothetical protein
MLAPTPELNPRNGRGRDRCARERDGERGCRETVPRVTRLATARTNPSKNRADGTAARRADRRGDGRKPRRQPKQRPQPRPLQRRRFQASKPTTNTSSSSTASDQDQGFASHRPRAKGRDGGLSTELASALLARRSVHCPAAATRTGRCAAAAERSHACTGARRSLPITSSSAHQSRRQRPSRRYERNGPTPSRSKGCRLHGAAITAHRGDATRFPRRTTLVQKRLRRSLKDDDLRQLFFSQGERCTTGGRQEGARRALQGDRRGLRKHFNRPAPGCICSRFCGPHQHRRRRRSRRSRRRKPRRLQRRNSQAFASTAAPTKKPNDARADHRRDAKGRGQHALTR